MDNTKDQLQSIKSIADLLLLLPPEEIGKLQDRLLSEKVVREYGSKEAAMSAVDEFVGLLQKLTDSQKIELLDFMKELKHNASPSVNIQIEVKE